MPIRAEFLELYRTPEYKARRKRIVVERDQNRCKRCQREAGQPYLNARNKWVYVQLGMAHLDQDPRNDADENLETLCRACHLGHDLASHVAHSRETRRDRKDAARPLLAAEVQNAARI